MCKGYWVDYFYDLLYNSCVAVIKTCQVLVESLVLQQDDTPVNPQELTKRKRITMPKTRRKATVLAITFSKRKISRQIYHVSVQIIH